MALVQTWREAWFGVLGMKKHRIYDGFSRPSQRWWELGNATWWFYDVFEHILVSNRCFCVIPSNVLHLLFSVSVAGWLGVPLAGLRVLR